MSEEPHDFYLIMALHEIFLDDAQYAGEMNHWSIDRSIGTVLHLCMYRWSIDQSIAASPQQQHQNQRLHCDTIVYAFVVASFTLFYILKKIKRYV